MTSKSIVVLLCYQAPRGLPTLELPPAVERALLMLGGATWLPLAPTELSEETPKTQGRPSEADPGLAGT